MDKIRRYITYEMYPPAYFLQGLEYPLPIIEIDVYLNVVFIQGNTLCS